MSGLAALDPIGPVVVRLATEADWPAIGALTTTVYGGERLVSDDYLDRMADTAARGADPHVRLLVATGTGDTVVGAVTYTRPGSGWADVAGPGEAGFRMLAVDPAARGSGVGAALVRACLRLATEDRLQRVAILTKDNMPAAARLYDRLGFRRAPWRDRRTTRGHALQAYVVDLVPIAIRECATHELGAVGQLTLAAYVADGLVDPNGDYAEHLVDAADRRRAATLLVAVNPKQALVGTVTFCRPGTPYAEISRPGESEFRMLAVHPSARGSGVGEALVHSCLDRAGTAGDQHLVLSTLDRMGAAGRLYERLGFGREAERDWSPVPGIELRAYRRAVLQLPAG